MKHFTITLMAMLMVFTTSANAEITATRTASECTKAYFETPSKALAICSKSDDPQSKYFLGALYLEGKGGVMADNKKGFELLSSSAYAGFISGMPILAALHAKGKGTKKSYANQYVWLQIYRTLMPKFAPLHKQDQEIYDKVVNKINEMEYGLPHELVAKLQAAAKERMDLIIQYNETLTCYECVAR